MKCGLPRTEDQMSAWLSNVRDMAPDTGDAETRFDFSSLVGAWQKWGVQPGEVVVLAMPNGTALVRHWLALLSLGAVPVCVMPSLPNARLRDLLSQLSASILLAPRLEANSFAAIEVGSIGGIDVLRLTDPGLSDLKPGEVILLTSGTSGFSSGCVFSIEDLWENACRHAESISLQPEETLLITLPLYFSYALVAQLLAALVIGCPVRISGPPFHIPTYLQHLSEEQIRVSALTPLLVKTFLSQRAVFPKTLRKLTVGGDQLAAECVGELLQARPGGELYMTYGLTEAGPRVSTLAVHQATQSQWGSVGWPLRDTCVHLEPLSEDSGERQLLIESSTVMNRRIGLVDSVRESLRRPGLIATGDIFQQDETGCLFFQRRLSDFMIRQGEKICLASIRRILANLPGVLAVRTELISGENQTEFDLHLTCLNHGGVPEYRGTSTPDYQQWERKLRGLLRRNEMPRAFYLHSADKVLAKAHK